MADGVVPAHGSVDARHSDLNEAVYEACYSQCSGVTAADVMVDDCATPLLGWSCYCATANVYGY